MVVKAWKICSAPKTCRNRSYVQPKRSGMPPFLARKSTPRTCRPESGIRVRESSPRVREHGRVRGLVAPSGCSCFLIC
eukprot:6131270-Prorocentrum_lima.AAC.1